jgi:nucleoside-diphosphate-sugar epimerase
MSRVLIAGFGYLGARLAPELVQSGYQVFGLSRHPREVSGVNAIEADLSDPSSLSALPSRLDHVVYMASAGGRDDERYRKAYVTGPQNLIRALEQRSETIRSFIFVSSTGVYEQSDGSWVDETSPTGSLHFSARRLLEGETVVRGAPWPAIVLRLSGIYGVGRTYWLDRIRSGEHTFAVGAGEFSNLIHVEDAARALAHLLSVENPEPVYIGTDSQPVEKRRLIEWLSDQLSLEPPRFMAPTAGDYGRGNKRCRNRRLLETGFRFRYPSFREGYRSILEKK